MAVDMTARARMPGTRKSTGCLVPVGSTCTAEKNSRNTTGMPKVRNRVSPLVDIMVSSARSWAASGLIGPVRRSPSATGARHGPDRTPTVGRPPPPVRPPASASAAGLRRRPVRPARLGRIAPVMAR